MFNTVSNKGKDFYYLFPGQGQGKRKRFLKHQAVAFVVGLIAAAVVAAIVYALQHN